MRYCLLEDLILCFLFSTDGLTNAVLSLYSLRTPAFSNFLLKRLNALSMLSLFVIVTPITAYFHLTFCSLLLLNILTIKLIFYLFTLVHTNITILFLIFTIKKSILKYSYLYSNTSISPFAA